MLAALFGSATNPEIREQVVKALYFKAGSLLALERYEEAIAVCEELEARFDGDDEPASTREVTADSRELRALALQRLGTPDAAIRLYDEVLGRYGGSDDQQAREHVAEALHFKAATLDRLGREEEALATYDDLLSRIDAWSDPSFDKPLARCLDRRGRVLAELGRAEEALTSFDKATEVLARLDPGERAPMLTEVLYRKAQALPEGREVEAVVLYDSVLTAYSECQPGLPSSATKTLVRAMFYKLNALAALGRRAEIDLVSEELATALGDVVERQHSRLSGSSWNFDGDPVGIDG
jgi:tetratricopeptide (TPR) repeat protein